MGIWADLFKQKETVPISEWESLMDDIGETYLRQMALESCITLIATRMRLVKFDSDNRALKWKMNVKPNRNMNAMAFRNKLIDRMVRNPDGALVIMTEDDEWVIADSFSVTSYGFKENEFSGITVGELSMRKKYKSSEVLHFTFGSPELEKYLRQLSGLYDKLLLRMHMVQMLSNQVRFYANFKTTRSKDSDSQEKFIKFLKGFENSVKTSHTVVTPVQDDFMIDEKTANYLGRSVEELSRVENIYLSDLCRVLGLPYMLLASDLSDISFHQEDMLRFTKSFTNIIISEILSKTTTSYNKKSFLKANYFDLVYPSVLKASADIQQAIGSSVFTIDDLLGEIGWAKEGTEETTRRIITKNFGTMEGGELVGNDDKEKSKKPNPDDERRERRKEDGDKQQ